MAARVAARDTTCVWWSLACFVDFLQIVGLAVGYFFQRFSYSVYIWAAGVVFAIIVRGPGAFVVCWKPSHSCMTVQAAVPPYPVYQQNPIQWLKELPQSRKYDGKRSRSSGSSKRSK